jgi:ribonuclease HI
MVDGVIETHHTWPECEKRVKGAKGAKYKKSTSFYDEQRIIEEFGTF